MRNLLLELSYIGSEFHGWQVQNNAYTVQECLQDALEKILGKRENVTGCSRTDAGVHAASYFVNFYTEHTISCYKLIAALNGTLPKSVAVRSCKEVDEAFHARYCCKSKEYVYRIWNASARNPFWEERALHYRRPLDTEELNRQARAYVGSHDFAGFCSVKCDVEDTVRNVHSFRVEREGDMVYFIVSADGFLYNMVRIMVGTLLFISEGKIEKGALPEVIASKDRKRAGMTAPAHGLYLNKVLY